MMPKLVSKNLSISINSSFIPNTLRCYTKSLENNKNAEVNAKARMGITRVQEIAR